MIFVSTARRTSYTIFLGLYLTCKAPSQLGASHKPPCSLSHLSMHLIGPSQHSSLSLCLLCREALPDQVMSSWPPGLLSCTPLLQHTSGSSLRTPLAPWFPTSVSLPPWHHLFTSVFVWDLFPAGLKALRPEAGLTMVQGRLVGWMEGGGGVRGPPGSSSAVPCVFTTTFLYSLFSHQSFNKLHSSRVSSKLWEFGIMLLLWASVFPCVKWGNLRVLPFLLTYKCLFCTHVLPCVKGFICGMKKKGTCRFGGKTGTIKPRPWFQRPLRWAWFKALGVSAAACCLAGGLQVGLQVAPPVLWWGDRSQKCGTGCRRGGGTGIACSLRDMASAGGLG